MKTMKTETWADSPIHDMIRDAGLDNCERTAEAGADALTCSAITDTQRLDWLQSHRKTVWKASHEEWGISTADPFMRAKIEVFDGWVVDPNDEPKRSIREAIDSAMFPHNAEMTHPDSKP